MLSVKELNGLYIGLMSGTSMDGIDAVIVELDDNNCLVKKNHNISYPHKVRSLLLSSSRNWESTTSEKIEMLDRKVGECFREATTTLLKKSKIKHSNIIAIGSHGQTIRHQPRIKNPYSLQIGNPQIIANGTQIKTIADFRRNDIDAGGQGAPLTPSFHKWFFSDKKYDRVILNIGGFSNITILSKSQKRVRGFDTGPGNSLMDSWIQEKRKLPFDMNGEYAKNGEIIPELFDKLSKDPYFSSPSPKSTGFEYFNLTWLKNHIGNTVFKNADIQATLLNLTVSTIKQSILSSAPNTKQVIVCGGGVHNSYLMTQISDSLYPIIVKKSDDFGLSPDYMEAVAFAWLAKQKLEGIPANIPSVTGANRNVILGKEFLPE